MSDTHGRMLIEQLRLQPHPEGGYFRETWRASAPPGVRAAGTAILFLLEAGQRSHWHRVDADEMWFWHAGHPLDLHVATATDRIGETVVLGTDFAAGQQAQGLVPAHRWQAAEASRGWALVSCTVTPGFQFSGFELAPPDWAPAR